MARGASLGEGGWGAGPGLGGLPGLGCPIVATKFMGPSGEDGPWSLGPRRGPVVLDTVPGSLDVSPVKQAQLLGLAVRQLLEHLASQVQSAEVHHGLQI